jgi:hypothetical protein
MEEAAKTAAVVAMAAASGTDRIGEQAAALGGWAAQTRREAWRRRAHVLASAGLSNHPMADSARTPTDAPTLLRAALQTAGLRCRFRSPGDALLSGAQAVLDGEAQTIWVRADLTPEACRLVIAHELGHLWLHHDAEPTDPAAPDGAVAGCCHCCAADDFDAGDAEDAAAARTMLLVGYGPRERREAEANLFAREFLLPLPLVRAWFWDEELCASDIAARVGLPLGSVVSQLSEALGMTEPASPPSPLPQPNGWDGVRAGAALDPTQRAAARAAHGPLLVGAGPGTGKTRTLTERVLFLVREQNVPPDKRAGPDVFATGCRGDAGADRPRGAPCRSTRLYRHVPFLWAGSAAPPLAKGWPAAAPRPARPRRRHCPDGAAPGRSGLGGAPVSARPGVPAAGRLRGDRPRQGRADRAPTNTARAPWRPVTRGSSRSLGPMRFMSGCCASAARLILPI